MLFLIVPLCAFSRYVITAISDRHEKLHVYIDTVFVTYGTMYIVYYTSPYKCGLSVASSIAFGKERKNCNM